MKRVLQPHDLGTDFLTFRVKSYIWLNELYKELQTWLQVHDLNPCYAEYFFALHSSPLFILLTCSISVVRMDIYVSF